MKFIWISLIKAKFIDQLRNLIIKKSAIITSGTKTFNFPGLIFAYALIPDNELRDAFQLKLKKRRWSIINKYFGNASNHDGLSKKCGTWVDELNDYLAENQRYVKDFFTDIFAKKLK